MNITAPKRQKRTCRLARDWCSEREPVCTGQCPQNGRLSGTFHLSPMASAKAVAVPHLLKLVTTKPRSWRVLVPSCPACNSRPRILRQAAGNAPRERESGSCGRLARLELCFLASSSAHGVILPDNKSQADRRWRYSQRFVWMHECRCSLSHADFLPRWRGIFANSYSHSAATCYTVSGFISGG